MKRSFNLSTSLVCTLTALVSVTVYSALTAKIIEQKTCFGILTLVLFLFLIREMARVWRLQRIRWLLNPAVICSLMTFLLYYVFTNIVFFLPYSQIRAVSVLPDITLAENKLMLLTIFAAIGMWLGYWSYFSTFILNSAYLNQINDKYFKVDVLPKIWVVPVFYLIANICRLAEVWLGVYWYSSTYEGFLNAAAYYQYLIYGDYMGLLTLIIISLQLFTKKPGVYRFYFVVVLTGELFWGMISGMKSNLILPFLCVIISQYIRTGKISKSWFIIIPVVVLIAYSVIDPFRTEKNNDPNFDGTTVSGLVSGVIKSQLRNNNVAEKKKKSTTSEDENVLKQEKDASVIVKVMSRTNLTYWGSFGIEFSDKNPILPPGSPDFLQNAILAPIGAIIPRFIWAGKPLQNIGLWYTQVVMHQPLSFSSTAMGLITNLYFIGGFIAVFIAFFLIGTVQRVIFFFSKPWNCAAGAILYLSLMTRIEVIAEVETQDIIAYILRMVTLVLIAQAFIYNHKQEPED